MMEWILENPKNGIVEAFIYPSVGGKCLLYVKHTWMASAKPVDDYLFPSDTAAKQYYGRYYQSVKNGLEKPKWVKKLNS